MSDHANRFNHRLRRAGSASIALTAAVLLIALGAGPATADPQEPGPVLEETMDPPQGPKDTPSTDSPTDTSTPPALATITGKIWEDTDKDGKQDDDEPGVESLVISAVLIPAAPPAVAKKGVVLTPAHNDSSGPNGEFTIPNLPAGDYAVTVSQPKITTVGFPKYRFTTANVPDNDEIDSDFTEVNIADSGKPDDWAGRSAQITVLAGTATDLDAGVWKVEPDTTPEPKNNGKVCGRAWNDKDRDGLQDAGEPGVAGLPLKVERETIEQKVALTKSAKSSRGTDQDGLPETDADGNFCVTGQPAGTYHLLIGAGPFDDSDGSDGIKKIWDFTTKDAGDDALDSDVQLIVGKKGYENVAISDSFEVKDDTTVDIDTGVYKDEPVPPATGGSLPVTGAAVGGFLAAGVLLVGGGVALTVLGRRRRKTTIA